MAGRLQTHAHDLARTAADQSVTFGYNPASQITSEARTNDAYASGTAYNVSRPYSANGLNQYTAAGAAQLSYDANGNLAASPAGDGGTLAYVYDAENRLVQATTSGGDGRHARGHPRLRSQRAPVAARRPLRHHPVRL